MPEFVIEKSIPGLGELSPFQQDQAVRRSCSTLHGVAPDVEWVQSYLTDDKSSCACRAPVDQVLCDLIRQWELAPLSSTCLVHETDADGRGQLPLLDQVP